MDKSNNRFHFIKSEYCLENDWVFDFVDSLENYVKEEKPKMLIKK